MVRGKLLFGLVGLGAVIVACSSTSSGDGSGSPDASCQSAAEALCAKYDECLGSLSKLVFTDNATCQSRVKQACLVQLEAPSTGATGAQLSQCAADIKAQSCDDALAKQPDSCKDNAGSLADGTACGQNAQCVNRYCRLATGSNCGSCSKKESAGGACDTSSGCDADLVCAGGKCVAPAAAGAACSATQPCAEPNRCVSAVCSKPIAAGGACDPQNDGCDSLKGLFCHPTNKVCTAVGVAQAGEPCGIINGGYTACAAGGNCKRASATASTGTCEAAAADGAKCDDTNGPRCTTPARCVGGVCTLPDPASCK